MSRDWLNNFVEKNAWSILAFILIFVVSYTTIQTKIEAHDTRLTKLEEAFLIQAQNQRDIIVLQQQQKTNDENIKEIKTDIKEIKKAMGLL